MAAVDPARALADLDAQIGAEVCELSAGAWTYAVPPDMLHGHVRGLAGAQSRLQVLHARRCALLARHPELLVQHVRLGSPVA